MGEEDAFFVGKSLDKLVCRFDGKPQMLEIGIIFNPNDDALSIIRVYQCAECTLSIGNLYRLRAHDCPKCGFVASNSFGFLKKFGNVDCCNCGSYLGSEVVVYTEQVVK